MFAISSTFSPIAPHPLHRIRPLRIEPSLPPLRILAALHALIIQRDSREHQFSGLLLEVFWGFHLEVGQLAAFLVAPPLVDSADDVL
jgi:hypothetical protein